MAIGDDALAAGIPIMTGSEPANTLDTEMNKTRDEIARRTSTVLPVAKGGTGSTTPAAARAALGAADAAQVSTDGNVATAGKIPIYNPDRQLTAADPTLGGHVATRGWTQAYAPSRPEAQSIMDGQMSPAVYNRTLGGSYHVLYADSTGLLGWVPSSRRYKKNIRPAEIDVDAVLAIEVVTFLYWVAIDPDGNVQHGVIAEQLHDLGLTWLVSYDTDGAPEGVRYDLLAVALLPVLQRQAADIEALTGRVSDIELHLDALRGDPDATTD